MPPHCADEELKPLPACGDLRSQPSPPPQPPKHAGAAVALMAMPEASAPLAPATDADEAALIMSPTAAPVAAAQAAPRVAAQVLAAAPEAAPAAAGRQGAPNILSRGHVTLESLVSTNLAADILAGVSMDKAAIISNALQSSVTGELRRRCEEELRSSSALAGLVEQIFGVRTFRVSTPKRLSTPCKAEPQMPHADDFCNRELIGIVSPDRAPRPDPNRGRARASTPPFW